jgi:hypothetical protein
MTSTTPLSDVDAVTDDDLRQLASADGPCVSIFLPTARHGVETLAGPRRLRNLLSGVEPQLADLGMTDAAIDELLQPFRDLVDDEQFWQHQAHGLALFASRELHQTFRVPADLVERASVGSRFRLFPLWSLVAGDDTFHILALSQNEVHLFDASRQTIHEIPLGRVPTSMAQALSHEDPERQLQARSLGAAGAQFHGHGAGGEIDKATLERYFRAVDTELVARLGSTRKTIVLACVDYYLPIYQRVTKLANLADGIVPGNPEHRSPDELLRAANQVLEPIRAARRATIAERFAALVGTGRTTTGAAEIVTAAHEGRVDTLLLRADPPNPDDPLLPSVTDALIDLAVTDVLATGGAIDMVEQILPASTPVAAILRY